MSMNCLQKKKKGEELGILAAFITIGAISLGSLVITTPIYAAQPQDDDFRWCWQKEGGGTGCYGPGPGSKERCELAQAADPFAVSPCHKYGYVLGPG